MRRLVYLLILVLAVGASATGVSASTDCERWFAAYRSQLAHSQSLQRLAAAKRRAKRYAQRKLAGYVKPKPTVHVPRGPRMNHHDALRKIELACGVLPESSPDQPLLAEDEPGEFIPDQTPPDEVGLLPGFDGPGTLLPEEGSTAPVFSETPPTYPGGGPSTYTPPYTTPGGGSGTPPPGGGGTPPPGGGGTPPPGGGGTPPPGGGGTPPPGGGGTPPPGGGGTPPPGGGGTPPPGGGGTPPPGGGGTPPPGGGGTPPPGGGGTPPPGGGGTPPPVVPEPSSIVLMLTGAAGAAGVIRRRFKA
jgi:hypothetical protein